jgi:hypothetical protein
VWLGGGPLATAQSRPQELLLQFSYERVIDDMVMAYSDGETVYLPIGALFEQLQIEARVSMEERTVRGFFIDPEATYNIDAGAGATVVDGTSFSFTEEDIVVGQLDLFVRAELLGAWFDLNFTPDLRELKLTLDTPHRVPRVAAVERERRQERLNAMLKDQSRPPVRFVRDRKLLGGGVLDYTLTARQRSEFANDYSYELRSGVEILGGDLEGGIQGEKYRFGWQTRRTDLRWRYTLHRSSVLSRVRLGDSFTNGLQNVPYTGVKLSNEPMAPRQRFARYTLDEQTGPNWTVEVYVNGQLDGVTTADESGHYTYDVPLRYGATSIRLREYGPKGGYFEATRRVNLPYSLLPPGEVEYDFYAGRRRFMGDGVVQGTAAMGLSERLTARVGVDYIGEPLRGPLLYGGASLRIGSAYVASIRATPGFQTRLSLNGVYPSKRRFDVQYAYYHGPSQGTLYNPTELNQELKTEVYLPWRVGGQRVTVQWSGQVSRTDDYTDLQAFPRLSIGLGPLGVAGARFRAWNRLQDDTLEPIRGDLTLDHFYWVPRNKSIPGPLRGISLRSRLTYDTRFDQWRTGRLSLARRLGSFARARLTLGRDFRSGFNFGGLRLSLTLPYTRGLTEARQRDGRLQTTQRLRGSIGYDHTHDRFIFSDRQWVGESAASVRFFIDENGNGVHDRMEQVIKSEAYYKRPVPTRQGSDRVIRSQGLIPYAIHSIDLTNAGPENPKWSPRYTAFSFRTDPNVYKPLDIPVFVGGTVEGTVTWLYRGKQTPAKGFTVHLTGVNSDYSASFPVFSDGTFYGYRIPPGTYHARVDRGQMRTYGLVAEPPRRTVRIKAKKDGDRVTGVDFILMSPDARKKYLAERRAPPARYIVHLGTFRSIDEARRFVGTLRNTQSFMTAVDRNLHGPLNIRREATRQYVVETDSFRVRWKPARLVTHLQTDPAFADVFMIEADVLDPTAPPNYQFGVQAGTYSTRSRAKVALQRLQEKISIPFRATIAEDPIDGAHKLILNAGATRKEAQQLRTWLSEREGILDTYVIALPARFLPGFDPGDD